MKKLLSAALISFTIINACKPVKKIQTVIPKTDTVAILQPDSMPVPPVDSALLKKQIYQKVVGNKIDFTYFLGKIKLDYNDTKGKNVNAQAYVRIKKDSIIWMSLTGALGIEGYRILVKPDTVAIMDKLEKTVTYKSVAYLQEFIKLPIDFYTLQDLLIGNPVFFADNIVSFRNADNTLVALSIGDYFKHLVTIDTTDNRILHSKLDDVQENRNRTCNISFSDYSKQQDRLFSSNREITITEKDKRDIVLDFKQSVFDEPQTFPFAVPKNYKLK